MSVSSSAAACQVRKEERRREKKRNAKKRNEKKRKGRKRGEKKRKDRKKRGKEKKQKRGDVLWTLIFSNQIKRKTERIVPSEDGAAFGLKKCSVRQPR